MAKKIPMEKTKKDMKEDVGKKETPIEGKEKKRKK